MKFLLIVASIAATAIAWGVYGPVLHWGQAGMGNGRLRPFICVGIAYFAIAVVVPMVLVYGLRWEANEQFGWRWEGTFWSTMGGVAGAVGALGIIMAFNFGGKPNYVMPLVFGFAPVINTLFTMYMDYRKDPEHVISHFSPFYAAGLILVLAGAITVLVFKPPPVKHASAKSVKTLQGAEKLAENRPHSLKPSTRSSADRTEFPSDPAGDKPGDSEESSANG
jgi:hypothetical protein